MAGQAAGRLRTVPAAHATADDSIGAYVRRRFGDEVHERLVDALVGSIYATDTDNASLAAVPQLAELAAGGRSLLLAARRRVPGEQARRAGPDLRRSRRRRRRARRRRRPLPCSGAEGEIRTSSPVAIGRTRRRRRGRVDGERFDAIVLASPARATAPLLAEPRPEAARLLGRVEYADVIIVTLAIPATAGQTVCAG